MSDTSFKGEIALMKVLLRAAEKRVTVCRPVADFARYDLVIDEDGRLTRAQVKYATRASQCSGAVSVHLSSRGRKGHARYDDSEIDAVLVYLPRTDKVYWLPPDVWRGKWAVQLRYEQSRNAQIKNCVIAQLYEW